MNRNNLGALTFLTIFFLAGSCLIYAVIKNNQEGREELSKACRAVNYELVTIKGRHYCLPFMPDQEVDL